MIDFELMVILFLFLGAITGLLSGLYGFGGGIVIVPFLYDYLSYFKLPGQLEMHIAVATSLLCMLFIAVNAIYWHYKAGDIVLSQVKEMLPWLVVGAFLGSLLGGRVHGIFLHELFVTVLLAGIILQTLRLDFFRSHTLDEFIHPTLKHNAIVSTTIGLISVMVGIGGSVMAVPYLRNARMPMLNAACVAVCLVPAISLLGSLGYIFTTHTGVVLPPDCWGLIYMPAFVWIVLGAVIGVPIGVRLSHILSDKILAASYFLLLIVLALVAMA
jgi:uncharacterized membrane protein YfcA